GEQREQRKIGPDHPGNERYPGFPIEEQREAGTRRHDVLAPEVDRKEQRIEHQHEFQVGVPARPIGPRKTSVSVCCAGLDQTAASMGGGAWRRSTVIARPSFGRNVTHWKRRTGAPGW